VIGDSFSFGHGVEMAEAWPSLLERCAAPVEVLNFAVPGYGTDQQLLLLEREIGAYHPDLVVDGFFEGQVFRNVEESSGDARKPRFDLGSNGELRRPAPVPTGELAPMLGRPPRSAVFDLVRRRGGELLQHLGFGACWRLDAALIREMTRVTRGAGARLVVMTIPKDQAVYGSGLRRAIHRRTMALIDAELDAAGVARFDTLQLLEAQARTEPASRLYYPLDGHWTQQAHRIVADAVCRRLTGWLPPAQPGG